jgi:formate dehydrogenase subunit gamma
LAKEGNRAAGMGYSKGRNSTGAASRPSPAEKRLPGYYFPLVAGIILVEVVILVLALLHILPIRPFEIYPEAGYYTFVPGSDLSHIAVVITRWFFFALTAGVMVPVTIIIILEVIRRFINRNRPEPVEPDYDSRFELLELLDRSPRNPNITPDRVEGEYIKRFDIHQRIQHYGLFITFIILAVTGVLRGFPDWPTFAFFTNLFGGPDLLRIVHDAAAFGMIAVCIYHIIYVIYGIVVKHKLPTAMVPNMKDLKDMLHTFLWIFGIYKHEPEYERFQYGQKIDYWAIFWGMPVMMITGFIMMVPAFFSDVWPGWAIAVAAAAHRDEAVLAISFIIIVHMYYGHLATTTFPVNTVMFTGKMLKSKYKQWFRREYDEIMEKVEESKE